MSSITDISQSGTYSPAVRQAGAVGHHPLYTRRVADETHSPEITVRPADSVDISALARKLGLITSGDQPQQAYRADLVDRVKSQIANGTYETPEKLDAAAEKLANELDVTG